jgi:putative membrane protein insertion efficiency factor
MKLVTSLIFFPRLPFLWLIKIYQKTISPDHGFFKNLFPSGYCRFYPSCSEYGYQIIKKRGLVVGFFKTIWRILRCNPWGHGGVDLPNINP